MVVVMAVGSQMAQSQTCLMTAGETKPASAFGGASDSTALTSVSNWNGTALAAASTCTVLVGNGSALTSWIQGDGPHFVYTDVRGHLEQFWYTIATKQWAAQDLTTVPDAMPAEPGSALTSWMQSDGPHVLYADANGHVRQLWFTLATGRWAAQDLTTVPNALPAGPRSPMTSWVQSDGPHVTYADANGHVRQLWYTLATGRWTAQDLTTVPNALPAGPRSPMTSWVQTDGPHIVYADANGHVRQLWYTVATGRWAAQDLTTVPDAVPAGPGSAMTSWLQSDGPHVVYTDANGHLRQLWYTLATGLWAAQDLTTLLAAVPAGPDTDVTSWLQSDGPHVVYADANGQVWQLWYTLASGRWAAQDLTTVPNAVPARTGSPMTSWVQASDGPHFIYADANGHVWQLWYTIATGQWAAQDLTAVL
jgi:hypothetical protein